MWAMKLTADRDVLELPRYGILRLRDAAGVALVCRRGLLWITQEGDDRDVVLSGGQSTRVEHDGVTLIEALQPAILTLDGYSEELGIRQPRSSVTEVLASA